MARIYAPKRMSSSLFPIFMTMMVMMMVACACGRSLPLSSPPISPYSSALSPSRFLNFLLNNKNTGSDLPLSYHVPQDYFKNIVPGYRTNASRWEDACGRESTPQELDAYTFQTEQLLTIAGINLYDAAVRTIALALLNHVSTAQAYEDNTLLKAATLQLGSIRGTAPCKGIQFYDQCEKDCGLCYGGYDAAHTGETLDNKHAYFFRLVSDYWSFAGTVDARCPEKNLTWTWNDWRPVAGENAWANFLGPLQVAYIKAGGNVDHISDDSTALLLAVSMFSTFKKMQMPNGGIAYAPWNTWDANNTATGGTASVENAASALAGLRALQHVIQHKHTSSHKAILPDLDSVITKLTGFIKSSYSSADGYFVQGGTYDTKGNFVWNADPESKFAVDCQTWVLSVVGGHTVDAWFGAGTALHIWTTTKKLGGFGYLTSSNTARGLGFSINQQTKVLSGEWTFGGINMLRSLAKQYPSSAVQLEAEAFEMRETIEDVITFHSTGLNSDIVNYANKRYWIPWGWYANPIPSMASIAWAVMVDSFYNPFVLGGGY